MEEDKSQTATQPPGSADSAFSTTTLSHHFFFLNAISPGHFHVMLNPFSCAIGLGTEVQLEFNEICSE